MARVSIGYGPNQKAGRTCIRTILYFINAECLTPHFGDHFVKFANESSSVGFANYHVGWYHVLDIIMMQP